MLPSRRRETLLAAAPALAALALIAPALLRGEGLLPTGLLWRVPPWSAHLPRGHGDALLADQLFAFWPWREFLRQELSAGRFPLWNPFLLGGVPFLGCVQAAPLFPLTLLLGLLPAVPASLAAGFLKIALAGTFMRLHARELGATEEGAALSGVVYALGGFMVAWLGHPQTNAACVLPALFWLTGRLAARPEPTRAGALALGWAALLLSGHPPTILHAALGVAAWSLFLSRTPRVLLLAAAAAAAGAALSAPALLPWLEYLRESSTTAASGALARWHFRLSPWELLHLVMPLASGSPARGFEVLQAAWGLTPLDNFIERAAWTGVVPLAFAARALTRKPSGAARFHAGLAVFGLASALGGTALLWKHLPGFSSVNPMRLVLFWTFGVAALAGLGLDGAKAGARGAAVPWALAGAAALAFLFGVARIWAGLEAAELSFAMRLLLLLGLEASCAWGLLARAEHRPWAVLAAAAFALVPALGVNPSAPASSFYPQTPEAAALKDSVGSSRALPPSGSFVPDTLMPARVRDARGEDFTVPRRYEEAVTGSAGDFGFWTSADAPPNVRRLVAVAPAPRALFVAKARSVPEGGALALVRDPKFDPSAEVLIDDGEVPASAPAKGTARFVDDGVNSVAVSVDATGTGWLVLLDGWMPGWNATVDGASASVRRADHAFRAVAVPEGKSTVVFRYRPKSLPLAVGLFLAAVAVLAAGLVIRL